MLFQVYGENSMYQILGWVLVCTALVLTNEIQRRSKLGGYGFFVGVLGALTVYFIAIYVGAARGAQWALNNQAVCRGRRVHRLHVAQVPYGSGQKGLVQGLPLCDRGHQHSDCCGQRL